MKILMLGLDSAGKTTILYKLKLNKIKSTGPTAGFNIETFQYKNIRFNMWDVGGQDRLRALWRHYYPKTNALIYVIDSSDKARIEEAQAHLYKIINELNSVVGEDYVLMVYANKQDLKGSLSPREIEQILDLNSHISKGQPYTIIGANALTGQGLLEGINWIANHSKIKQQQRSAA